VRKFLVRRLLFTIPVCVAVVFLVFLSLHLTPGDPVMALLPPESVGTNKAEREELANELRKRLGLDQPFHIQLLRYFGNLARLDLGNSAVTRDPIGHELAPRYQATLELAVASMLVAVAIGVGVGILSATRPNTPADAVATTLSLAGLSMPSFVLGLLLMLVFALYLGWLPPSGRPASAFSAEGFRYLLLPAVTLGLQGAGLLVRLTRSQMLEVLREDYVRTARAKGMRERWVVYRHALRNAMIPIVTALGLQFGFLLSGAIVVESVFAFPGVGRYLVQSVLNRDFPAVQSSVLLVSLTFVAVNLLVDALYALLDPRIRYAA
jgi:ABC-type dipeptide/oligopeptide/nickel transport system permease component